MTKDEMKALRPGDMVEHAGSGLVYVVAGNFGDRVTAVRIADITNPPEWHRVVRYETKEQK